MATAVEIGKAADQHVAYWLREFGYRPNLEKKAPEAKVLEVRGNAKSLLVQIQTALQPNTPDSLSADETRDLVARAAQLGWEPWEARVQLDEKLEQVGKIQWRKLT